LAEYFYLLTVAQKSQEQSNVCALANIVALWTQQARATPTPHPTSSLLLTRTCQVSCTQHLTIIARATTSEIIQIHVSATTLSTRSSSSSWSSRPLYPRHSWNNRTFFQIPPTVIPSYPSCLLTRPHTPKSAKWQEASGGVFPPREVC
jgi:hypothetical protein